MAQKLHGRLWQGTRRPRITHDHCGQDAINKGACDSIDVGRRRRPGEEPSGRGYAVAIAQTQPRTGAPLGGAADRGTRIGSLFFCPITCDPATHPKQSRIEILRGARVGSHGPTGDVSPRGRREPAADFSEIPEKFNETPAGPGPMLRYGMPGPAHQSAHIYPNRLENSPMRQLENGSPHSTTAVGLLPWCKLKGPRKCRNSLQIATSHCETVLLTCGKCQRK